MEKGVSLYFAVVVMAILLAISIGLGTIIISQLRIVRGMGDSVIALHAADTGIERGLYAILINNELDCTTTPPTEFEYLNQSVGLPSYSVTYSVRGICPTLPPSECPSSQFDFFCLKSVGIYKGTQRTVEASY